MARSNKEAYIAILGLLNDCMVAVEQNFKVVNVMADFESAIRNASQEVFNLSEEQLLA